jgi:hypothetical protein
MATRSDMCLRLQDAITIGTADGCGLRMTGESIADKHARVFHKGGRMFCRALLGDPDDLRSATHTWILPDTHLRAGVDYMLSPGAQLSFGTVQGEPVTVNFDEAGGSAGTASAMMGLLASGASAEVKARLTTAATE